MRAGRGSVPAHRLHRHVPRSHIPRSLRRALIACAAAAVLPGAGHLLLRRRRVGAAILTVFVLVIAPTVVTVIGLGRAGLLRWALDSRVLLGVIIGCALTGVAWAAVIVRTYLAGRPTTMSLGRRMIGVTTVSVLCLLTATPFGLAADLARSQRDLVDSLFPTTPTGSAGDGGADASTLLPPRVNILLFGSDAGTDRTGTRSDSMMVASIDTTTARAVVFGLPRNIERAPFPPGSAMAAQFPHGFYDPRDPLSGDYLLNAEYTYATTHPELAPTTPTADPGLNLLMSSTGQMLGLPVDYYIKVDMAGFAAIIDAIGGVTIDVGPVPLPIGGVLPDGTHVKPDGYLPAGVHHLDGNQALWYVRSRRDSDDYSRMSRQRCLINTVLAQQTVPDLLTHFQAIAAATTDSVSTNIPQSFLPSLTSLLGAGDDNTASTSQHRQRGHHARAAHHQPRVRSDAARPPPGLRPVRPVQPGRRLHAPRRSRSAQRRSGHTDLPPDNTGPHPIAGDVVIGTDSICRAVTTGRLLHRKPHHRANSALKQ